MSAPTARVSPGFSVVPSDFFPIYLFIYSCALGFADARASEQGRRIFGNHIGP